MRWLLSITGIVVAISVTATMDGRGLANLSALPLFPVTLLFWAFSRIPARDIGLFWGRPGYYVLAALYPALVVGVLSAAAMLAGATDLSHARWTHAWINAALLTVVSTLLAILTEEGFFRGWLWASLARAGLSRNGVLISTSVAFALWHVSSSVLAASAFKLPAGQVPIYILNAAAIGAVFGLLREASGSILVSSLGHGLWNGLAYVGFGEAAKRGVLGVSNVTLFGPEVGYLGLALNLVILAISLWLRRSSAINRSRAFAKADRSPAHARPQPPA